MTALDSLLQSYRDAAVTEREKGSYFERLACAYLTADPVQAEEYAQVWSWSDWAAQHGRSGKDVGIDLVAKLRNEDGFAAIQCKFYSARHRIQKADIDGFISASGKAPFVRRVVVDTTEVPWGANAEDMITGQNDDLEAARRDLRQSEEALSNLESCVENLGRFENPSNCLR